MSACWLFPPDCSLSLLLPVGENRVYTSLLLFGAQRACSSDLLDYHGPWCLWSRWREKAELLVWLVSKGLLVKVRIQSREAASQTPVQGTLSREALRCSGCWSSCPLHTMEVPPPRTCPEEAFKAQSLSRAPCVLVMGRRGALQDTRALTPTRILILILISEASLG